MDRFFFLVRTDRASLFALIFIPMQVRAGLMVLIYRKSLKLSSAHGGIGNVINLISNDCNRVAESFVNFHFLWSSALEILGEQ